MGLSEYLCLGSVDVGVHLINKDDLGVKPKLYLYWTTGA